MLNDNKPKKEKKPKNYADPTKWQLFWRVQKECLRRAVTVFLMYLFMGMLMLVCQSFDSENTTILEAVLGFICLLGGMAFNAHLCYNFGGDHYEIYMTGELYRANKAFGGQIGGDYHAEKEFRFWKGFLIGLYVGLVVVIFGCIAGAGVTEESYSTSGYVALFFMTFMAVWAVIPISWIRDLIVGSWVSYYWSVLFAVIPVVISGAFYILGAMMRKRKKREEQLRMERVAEAREKAKQEVRVQTEEQRKKTLQSKKKK